MNNEERLKSVLRIEAGYNMERCTNINSMMELCDMPLLSPNIYQLLNREKEL